MPRRFRAVARISYRSDGAAGAKQLGHRPGLERAAGRGVRRRSVRRLGDRAEPPLAEVARETVEQVVGRHADAAGGVDVRADQPRPDGALVVGRVALRRARRGGAAGRRDRPARATAGRAVSGAARTRPRRRGLRPCRPLRRAARPAARRRAAGSDATPRRRRRVRRRRREARGRRPGRSARRTTARAVVERPAPAIGAAQPSREVEGLDPQRVHLDRLADPRRHRDAVDAGVHPRQRPAVLASAQQPVARRRRCRSGCRRCAARRSLRAQARARRRGRRRRSPRRDGRARGRTRACRRRCCTRASRCRPCSRASPRRASPPRAAARRAPPRRGRWRGRAPRTTSSGRATTRRTTGSRRPPSGPSWSITNWSAASTSCVVDLARDARPQDEPGRSLARARDERRGGRERTALDGPAAAVTSWVSPARSSTAKAPAAQRSSRSFSPRAASSRARTPRYHSPPGRQPGPDDTVGALEDEAVRRRLDRRVTVRESLAVDAPPRAERRELEPRPAGRRTRAGARLRPRSDRAPSRSRARGRRSRSASATAARRRSRAKETSSSWPRGSTAPEAHSSVASR